VAMIVCPVCEHSQERGLECELCGRSFAGAPEPTAPAAPMAELEPTRAPPAGAAREERVPGLEVNAHDPVEAPPAAIFPDLEPSAAAPVDVTTQPIPDLDRGLEGLPADEPTPFPAVVVCRYCRTEAQLGEKLCSRCGMRLPTVALVPPPAAEEARVCSCGTPVRGSLCRACGARHG